ncbi:MAG: hypothetical protein JW715_16035 [Sedimentisphaerales bacterium]|nr:hypothetical protein [Sedimentisphaerales bacterium]
MVRHKIMIFYSIVIFILICACVLLIHFLFSGPRPDPKDIFRQYVMNPIPESVTNIKADQPKQIGGYGYVLSFNIYRADMDLIIKSRSLKEARITGFLGSGSLCFTWKDSPNPTGCGFSIYGSHKPSWYTLESWDNPEIYALTQEVKDKNTSDIQVLIYNPTLRQAFFIVFDYGGEAIWG